MGMGLGHLIDLSRKLENNKNLLSARRAKTKSLKLSRKISLKGIENNKTFDKISEKELNQIKKNIRERIRKEKRKENIITGIGILTFIGIIFACWFLLWNKVSENYNLKDRNNRMKNRKISLELIKEAKRHPNGWVYVLDKEYEGKEEVPAEFIKGAWKVNESGEITEEFNSNPNYHANKK